MAGNVKQIRRVLGKQENANMRLAMSQMMGGSDADVEIIVPKFRKITDQAMKVMKILTQFATFANLRRDFPETVGSLDEILKFVATATESISSYVKITEAKLYSMEQKNLNILYKNLKGNSHIKLLITVAGEIKTWCPNIADEKKLDNSYVTRSVGAVCPFSFSSLELRHIWTKQGTTDAIKKYIMMVIHKVYIAIAEIYSQITSPDIDTEMMSLCVFEALAMLNKVPELKGCNKAFAEIQKHTVMFKSNFNSYYKDAVISNNSNIIIERYLLDITTHTKDKSVLTQLGRIVAYVRRQTKSRGGISKEAEATFSVLEGNLKLATSEDKDDSDATADTAPATDTAPAADDAPQFDLSGLVDCDDTDAVKPADDIAAPVIDEPSHENPFWKPDFALPKMILGV